jgi:hypothetical protein
MLLSVAAPASPSLEAADGGAQTTGKTSAGDWRLNVLTAHLEIDVGPGGKIVTVHGTYLVENSLATAVPELLITFPEGVATATLGWNSADEPIRIDMKNRARAVSLKKKPLGPGRFGELRFSYQLPDALRSGFVILGRLRSSWSLPVVSVALSAQPQSVWDGGEQRQPDGAGGPMADSQSSTLIQVTTDEDWRCAASGVLIDQNVVNRRRVSRFGVRGLVADELYVVASRFQEASAVLNKVRVRVLTGVDTDPVLGQRLLEELAELLRTEEGLLGRYPWDGLTLAELDSPTMPGRGGETYRTGMFLPEETLRAPALMRVRVMAHELVHQWHANWTSAEASSPAYLLGEAIADEISLQSLRTLYPGSAVREWLDFLRWDYFRSCQEASEPAFGHSSNDDPHQDCASSVLYVKGGLGLTRIADFVGVGAFNQRLRMLSRTREVVVPEPTPRELTAALSWGPEARPLFLEFFWNRVTYRNQATARVSGDSIEVTVTAHRFDGGAGSSRHELNEPSTLPLGVVNCAGEPSILQWVTVENAKPTVFSFKVGQPIFRAGVDPWNELLDDGAVNLARVQGGAGCPPR